MALSLACVPSVKDLREVDKESRNFCDTIDDSYHFGFPQQSSSLFLCVLLSVKRMHGFILSLVFGQFLDAIP